MDLSPNLVHLACEFFDDVSTFHGAGAYSGGRDEAEAGGIRRPANYDGGTFSKLLCGLCSL